MKYADTPAGISRLRREYSMLQRLPLDIGPKPLRFGNFTNGVALVISALPGTHLRPQLPPDSRLNEFLSRLSKDKRVPLGTHPWIGARSSDKIFQRIIDPLEKQSWPIVIQHGDLAPWNLVSKTANTPIAAFDWEYGDYDGFPHLDYCYFILRVAQSVHRWAPKRAFDVAVRTLVRRVAADIHDRRVAAALVRLAAYDFYQKAEVDGVDRYSSAQLWRQAIWSSMED